MNVSRLLTLFGLCTAALLGLFALLLLFGANSYQPPTVLAIVNTPTNTPGPTPTPKSSPSGPLTGVYDVQTSPDGGTTSWYQCVVRTDQYSSGGTYADAKSATQCYVTDGLAGGDPNGFPLGSGYPPIGPPPPPPYGISAPAKGVSQVTAGPVLTSYYCFPNAGGNFGVNIIARTVYSDPLVQLNTTGKAVGDLYIYYNQGIAQCDSIYSGSPSPAGSPSAYISYVHLFLTDTTDSRCAGHGGGCVLAPWRSALSPTKLYSANFCTDSDRLWQDKAGSLTSCGDDPWNANDVENSTNASGLYTLQATTARADVCWGSTSASNPGFCATQPDGTLVPGTYINCDADILQGTQISPGSGANDLLARTLCYFDSPSIVINPEAASNQTLCPPAAAQYCGDGRPGAPPAGCSIGTSCTNTRPDYSGGGCIPDVTGCQPSRWQFSHIHLASGSTPHHTELTGTVDSGNNLIDLAGCIVDDDGHAALGNVYVALKLNLQTGHGYMAIYTFQTTANCNAGTPTGTPTLSPVDAVRQATDSSSPSREAFDSDGDRCPDVTELTADRTTGGLRDPYNPYDYFEVTNDHLVRVDDILAIAAAYGKDEGQVGYSPIFDRSGIPGSNGWNLGPGDGRIRVSDIVAEAFQAFNDCSAVAPAP